MYVFLLQIGSVFRYQVYHILPEDVADLRAHRIEYFHCYNDNRRVRSSVFDLIASSSANPNVDCLVVDKSKVSPFLRDESRFYPEMLGLLLSLVQLTAASAY